MGRQTIISARSGFPPAQPTPKTRADSWGRFVSPARSAGQPLGPPVCRPLPSRARVASRRWRMDPTCQLPLLATELARSSPRGPRPPRVGSTPVTSGFA